MGQKSLKQMEKDFPAESWDPAPTAPNGGLPRMIQIWEKLREINTGGYGSHRLVQVAGWSPPDGRALKVTSCSPFTATAIGMMYDKDGGLDKAKWEPKYDDGKTPLPSMFYAHHNGDLHAYYPTRDYLKKHKDKFPYTPDELDNSAISNVFWGLGYEIDPRDMRRGDLIGINWQNGHGHATFCWDVHLNADGEVDAFLYLSSNGNGAGGPGVSISSDPVPPVITKSGDKYTGKDVFKDRDQYIARGVWHLLPAQYVGGKKFDPTSFKLWPQIISWQGDYSVGSLNVARFYGFKPPETPHGKLFVEAAEAKRMYDLHKFEAPEPVKYATGTCEKPGGKKASSKPTPKSNPEPKKAVAPTEVKQKKEDTQGFQNWIETTLAALFAAKWIDKDPGEADSTVDAQSKAALEDFQKKFDFKPVDGLASPEVRNLLKQVLGDLKAGKPNPNDKNRKAEIETFAWSPNVVDPGGSVNVSVTGKNLDLIKKYEVTISDGKGGSHKASLEMEPKHGVAASSLSIPDKFVAGSVLQLEISGEGAKKSSNATLSIKKPPPRGDDWPWDEKQWPQHVKDMIAQLRAAPKGKGDGERRNITQYGIWDRVADGDVEILDQKGRPLGHTDKKCLFLADIAGAMRLDGKILNLVESGNVFDPRAGTAMYDKFDPKRSRWIDVCKEAPWGMGAKMPLIPFRTLAYNAAREKDLYGKKVYIKQLDGVKLPTGETHNGVCIIGDCGSMEPEKQFDLFIGPEGRRVSIPPQCNVEIL